MNPVENPATPGPHALPAWDAPGPEDQAWEADLLGLLAGLETARARLDEACAASQSLTALAHMAAAVGQLHVFLARQAPADLPGAERADLAAACAGYLADARALHQR